MERWKLATALLLLLAFTLITRIPFLSVPIASDESQYAYIADGMLHGTVPYRDAWDQKPPGIYFLLAGLFSLFGHNLAVLRLTYLAAAAATAGLVFLFTRELYDEGKGLIAAFAFSFLSGTQLLIQLVSIETFMILFTTAAFFLLARACRKPGTGILLLAGAMFGAAALFKQPAALEFAAALIASPFIFRKWARRSPLKPALLLCAGFIAAFLPFCAYFLLNGAFSDFFGAAAISPISFTLERYSAGAQPSPLLFLLVPLVLLPSAFVASGIALLNKGASRIHLLPAVWLVAAFAGTIPGAQYAHYFLETVPALSVLSALGVSCAIATTHKPSGSLARGATIALAVLLTITLLAQAQLESAYYSGYVETGAYGGARACTNEYQAAVSRVAGIIRSESQPNDTLLCFLADADASLYLASGRLAPGPYFAISAPGKWGGMVLAIGEKQPLFVVTDGMAPEGITAAAEQAVSGGYELRERAGALSLYERK